MLTTTPKLVVNENNNPVAVLLDYQDWSKIKKMLTSEEVATEILDLETISHRAIASESALEVNFTFPLKDISETHKTEAKNKAKKAYIMELLRCGDISTGRAAELLDMPRLELIECMGEYNISIFPDYTSEELEREVNETVKMLEQYKK